MAAAASFERFLAGIGDQFELMEGMIRTSPFPLWAKDYRSGGDGIMRAISSAYSMVWRIPPDLYVGRTDYDAWREILPDSEARRIADLYRANDEIVMQHGKSIDTVEETPGATIPEYEVCRVFKWMPSPGERVVMGMALPMPAACQKCGLASPSFLMRRRGPGGDRR